MSEITVQKPIAELCKTWQNLKRSLYECDEIRLEVFYEAFRETEQHLQQFISKTAISKAYMPLITDAYAFVDAQAGEGNVQMQAAKILTERMLYQYLVNEDVNPQNASCVTIYILKTMRQLTVDFSEVSIAMKILKEALQF